MYLGNAKFKSEFWAIVVMENRSKGILFKWVADLSSKNFHLMKKN